MSVKQEHACTNPVHVPLYRDAIHINQTRIYNGLS